MSSYQQICKIGEGLTYGVWLLNKRNDPLKLFICQQLNQKLHRLQYTPLGDPCTPISEFFKVRISAGNPLLTACWKSPSLLLWPTPCSERLPLQLRFDLLKYTEVTSDESEGQTKTGRCSLDRTSLQKGEMGWRIVLVKDPRFFMLNASCKVWRTRSLSIIVNSATARILKRRFSRTNWTIFWMFASVLGAGSSRRASSSVVSRFFFNLLNHSKTWVRNKHSCPCSL